MNGALPDILAANLSVVFCGPKPSIEAAAMGHYFVGSSGIRFWHVLHQAGFTPTQIDPMQDTSILSFGYGLTAVAARAIASADEVTYDEFIAGCFALRRKIERYAPRIVAFLGKAAFAPTGAKREVSWGRQPDTIGGAATWILPHPAGRDRGFSVAALVDAYGQLRSEID